MEHDTTVRDHQGLEVLPIEECWARIAGEVVGRLAFVQAGEPVVLPVNHAVRGHRIVLRTAHGSILDEALDERPVAFEVDGFDIGAREGWSVLVRGVAHVLDDDAVDPSLDAWADTIERDVWVEILAEEVTGRRITPRQPRT